MEIWKKVEGFNYYEISNLGNLRVIDRTIIDKRGFKKVRKEQLIKFSLSSSGYLCVPMKNNSDKYKNNFIHRLVAITFIPNSENKSDVNHIDGNKLNNNVENLEWNTHKKNMNHSYKILKRSGVNLGRFSIKNKASIKVKQLDLKNNLIKIWNCMMDFQRETGKRARDISAVLKGRQKLHMDLNGKSLTDIKNMSKKKEKKKEENYSFEEIDHVYGEEELKGYEKMWKISLDESTLNVITSTRTSSCGSIQIKNLEITKGYVIPTFTKQQISDFLENLYDNEYNNYNHFYFIDRNGGFLEIVFKDQGFTKVWTYLNKNSENHVNMWCLNRWTDDEINDELNDEDSW